MRLPVLLSHILFCAACVCMPSPRPHSCYIRWILHTTTKKNKTKKRQKNNAHKTNERKRRKVMTTLSDMVMQCGGGGCCVLEQCFQYPRRAREPRDCGCQFALLHRADIAWPSVHVLKSQFYLLVALSIHAGEKPRLYRGSHPVSLLRLSHPHTFFCVCVTYVVLLSLSVSVYFSVSLLSPLVYFMIFFSSSNYLAITNSSSVYSRDPLDQYICLLEFMWVIRRVDFYFYSNSCYQLISNS